MAGIDEPETGIMNRHSEMVCAGAVSIETYVDGDGPAVVVIPSHGRGGGEDFESFTAAVVAAGYRVLRPQPRGVGRSAGPMTGVDLRALGDDIARVIEQLGNGFAVVLGHAFGHIVARAVAANHPGKVSAVILAAAAGRSVPPEINSAPMRGADLTRPDDERLAALRLAFFAPGHDASIWLRGWYPETLKMQVASITADRANLMRYWAAGTAPIFEIIAARDPFHRPEQWGDLRAQFRSRVTSTIIEGASHALFPEQPAAVANAVISYLDDLKLSPPTQRLRSQRLLAGGVLEIPYRTRACAWSWFGFGTVVNLLSLRIPLSRRVAGANLFSSDSRRAIGPAGYRSFGVRLVAALRTTCATTAGSSPACTASVRACWTCSRVVA
jgi:pimeloyl-ACP methyl ester carboxylesterase